MTALTVLVVDDEPGMRETLTAILETNGYRVTSAPDGESAFVAVRDESFDVVVMDVKLPGRDGVSVLEEMDNPPPQVILMTAYAQEQRLKDAVNANAYAIVHKPFEARRMLGLVAGASKAPS